MKAKYAGYEAKRASNFVQLPPEGVYIGKILEVRVEPSYDKTHDQIVLLLDITEGEYANRYTEQYNDAKERFDNAKSKGVLRITVPEEDDPADKAWIKKTFESNLWAVEQSNPPYQWDWDEKKLKGKKVGLNVRKRFYTYNGTDRETTEIAQLESIEEVRAGKVKVRQPRDSRTNNTENNGTDSYEDVTNSVEVPF